MESAACKRSAEGATDTDGPPQSAKRRAVATENDSEEREHWDEDYFTGEFAKHPKCIAIDDSGMTSLLYAASLLLGDGATGDERYFFGQRENGNGGAESITDEQIDTLYKDCERGEVSAEVMDRELEAKLVTTATWSAMSHVNHLSPIVELRCLMYTVQASDDTSWANEQAFVNGMVEDLGHHITPIELYDLAFTTGGATRMAGWGGAGRHMPAKTLKYIKDLLGLVRTEVKKDGKQQGADILEILCDARRKKELLRNGFISSMRAKVTHFGPVLEVKAGMICGLDDGSLLEQELRSNNDPGMDSRWVDMLAPRNFARALPMYLVYKSTMGNAKAGFKSPLALKMRSHPLSRRFTEALIRRAQKLRDSPAGRRAMDILHDEDKVYGICLALTREMFRWAWHNKDARTKGAVIKVKAIAIRLSQLEVSTPSYPFLHQPDVDPIVYLVRLKPKTRDAVSYSLMVKVGSSVGMEGFFCSHSMAGSELKLLATANGEPLEVTPKVVVPSPKTAPREFVTIWIGAGVEPLVIYNHHCKLQREKHESACGNAGEEMRNETLYVASRIVTYEVDRPCATSQAHIWNPKTSKHAERSFIFSELWR